LAEKKLMVYAATSEFSRRSSHPLLTPNFGRQTQYVARTVVRGRENSHRGKLCSAGRVGLAAPAP